MKLVIFVASAMLAMPLAAQTTNDDATATENWWDEVGAGFFSDASLQQPRPEYEIRAQWTGLSADDQVAVRARCSAGLENAQSPSLQEGSGDEDRDATATELTDDAQQAGRPLIGSEAPAAENMTTTTGSVDGQEVQRADPANKPEPYTGLAGSDVESPEKMVMICDLIQEL